MKKIAFLLTLISLSVLFAPLPSRASSGYDLAVTDVDIVSCNQGGESPSIYYEKYLEGRFGEDSGAYSNLEMLEVADDESWFRYAEHENSLFGTMTYKVVCLKVEIEAEGDFSSLAETDVDSAPTSWDDYFEFLPLDIASAIVVVPSSGMPDHTFTPYYYQSGGIDQIYSPDLEDENTFYAAVNIYENVLNPDDSIDLIVAIDNTFSNDRGLFSRTFFDDVRHYNDGPVFAETDETNNIYYVENFLNPWMDHLPATDPEITAADNDSFTVEWDVVDGANEYFVAHWRKHLSNLSESFVYSESQTDLSYEAPLAEGTSYIDCVYIVPIDDDGVFGAASDNLCMGAFFTDVDDGLWYTDYTHNAVQNGMISGYADSDGNLLGTFGPADTITTSQALKMVAVLNYRFVNPDLFAFTLPYSLPSNLENHWANEYILSGNILGFDLVKDLNSFEPDRNITRAEMINLIVESMEVEVPHYSSYSLTDISDHKYADEIQLAYNLGIISGYAGTSTFGPDNSLLRAEAVKIFVEAGNAFSLTWPGYTY